MPSRSSPTFVLTNTLTWSFMFFYFGLISTIVSSSDSLSMDELVGMKSRKHSVTSSFRWVKMKSLHALAVYRILIARWSSPCGPASCIHWSPDYTGPSIILATFLSLGRSLMKLLTVLSSPVQWGMISIRGIRRCDSMPRRQRAIWDNLPNNKYDNEGYLLSSIADEVRTV